MIAQLACSKGNEVADIITLLVVRFLVYIVVSFISHSIAGCCKCFIVSSV